MAGSVVQATGRIEFEDGPTAVDSQVLASTTSYVMASEQKLQKYHYPIHKYVSCARSSLDLELNLINWPNNLLCSTFTSNSQLWFVIIPVRLRSKVAVTKIKAIFQINEYNLILHSINLWGHVDSTKFRIDFLPLPLANICWSTAVYGIRIGIRSEPGNSHQWLVPSEGPYLRTRSLLFSVAGWKESSRGRWIYN